MTITLLEDEPTFGEAELATFEARLLSLPVRRATSMTPSL